MYYPDSLICFSPLGLGEDLHQLHLEVREHWNLQDSSMLLYIVLPEWLVLLLLFQLCKIDTASHEQVCPSLSSIFTFNLVLVIYYTINLVAQPSSPVHAH